MSNVSRLFAILALAGLLFAGGRSGNARADFRFRINEDLGTLDWGYGEVNRVVVQQLMEGLTTSGAHGEPVPALAVSWRQVGKSYIFTLRPQARWSDGVPVCAQQFVDAWMRVLDPKFGSPYAHYLFDIKNAREFHAGRVTDPALLGLRAPECRRLEVELEHPAAFFPALTSHWVFDPIRLDLIRKLGGSWTNPEQLVVTGPYVLERWERDKQFVLKRNAAYFGKPAGEERLRALVVSDDSTALALFRAGSIDWAGDVPFLEKPSLSASPAYHVYPSYVEYHLGFLFGSPTTLPARARCALSMALDKREIPQLLKGEETPAWSIVPPELAGGRPTSVSRFNPEQARKLWTMSGMGKKLTLNFYSKDIHGMLMQWVQQQWKKNLGLAVELEQTEGKTYWARLQHDPTLIFLSGITASFAHPYTFLSEFLSDSKANWGRFSSKRYDSHALRVAGLAVGSRNVADEAGKAQTLLLDEECAAIPLYFRKTSALLAQGWAGFELNPMTYVYLKNVRRLAK